jgi:hypothetical protein
MAMTIIDRGKQLRNPFAVGLIKQISTADEMFSVLPVELKRGMSFSYEREVSTGTHGFIAPGGSVTESSATSERVDVSIREATSDVDVANYAEDVQQGEGPSAISRQIMAKGKAAGRLVAQTCITGNCVDGVTMESDFPNGPLVDALVAASPFILATTHGGAGGSLKYTHSGTTLAFRAPGDSSYGAGVDISGGDGNFTLASGDPSKWITVTLDISDATTAAANNTRGILFTTSTNAFDGLPRFVKEGSSQLLDSAPTVGNPLTFSLMDQLRDGVRNRSGLVAYVMNQAALRYYKTLVRALGGVTMAEVGGRMFPTHDGTPILVNDWIASTESASDGTPSSGLTSVYCANFASEDAGGVFLAVGGGDTLTVDGDPRDRTMLGFRVRDVGQVEGSSKHRTRLSFYGALGVGSDLSLTRARRVLLAAS